MKTLPVALLCLTCGFALAEDSEQAGSDEFHDLQIRLVTFEQIDVTADKEPSQSAEALSDEIESILRDAAELEPDETEE